MKPRHSTQNSNYQHCSDFKPHSANADVLQLFLLFFTCIFFIACNLYKFWIYKDIGYTDILFFVFTWIYFPIECMILYFGYIGNIRESVSLIYLAVSRVDCISYFHLLFQNSNLSCDHFSKISVSP